MNRTAVPRAHRVRHVLVDRCTALESDPAARADRSDDRVARVAA